MNSTHTRERRHPLSIAVAVLAAVLLLPTLALGSAQGQASVSGRIVDELGDRIPTARVFLVDASGAETDAETDAQGRFSFRNVAPGIYRLRVEAEGFAEYLQEELVLSAGSNPTLEIAMQVAGVLEEVAVTADTGVSVDPSENAGAIVLKGQDIEALPEDPDELAEALREMAGPGAGPGGGQFYIDGFSGGRLPPKDTIREIRINSNPFSAEYDRLGFGRIEIFTKPGTDRWRGSTFFAFRDEALNARDPFAPSRAAEQIRRYGGNIGGPLGSKASFFFDFERREDDEANTVAATILDPSLNPVFFSTTVPELDRRTTFAPRVDLQVGDKHTLIFRYDFTDDQETGGGVGGFALPSRAVTESYREQVFSFTDTWLVSSSVVSETRLQLIRRRSRDSADMDPGGPAIVVSDAFLDGSPAGITTADQDRFELQQYFTFVTGDHSIRAGVRARGISLANLSTSNYVGTFTFAGDVERDPVTGAPLSPQTTISSLEQYRRTLLGLPGYTASQFTLNSGNPFASTNQFDVGAFVQDEWRVRPNFTLSLGLRYEGQTNTDDAIDIAPRIGAAYAFNGSDGRPTTVLRGGFGIFYDRVDEGLSLNEIRFDGVRQEQYFIPRPIFFPNVPTADQLDAFAVPVSIRQLNVDDTPYTIQGSFSVEHQLPGSITGSVTWLTARGVHQLRSRNINAPDPVTGRRPFGIESGNIFAYESTGLSRRNQLRFSVNRRTAGPLTFFMTYGLNWSFNDTDGVGSFPSSSYDLSNEYGRSGDGSRHFLFLGSFIRLPWGFQVSPFIFARSGSPYNVTVGRDLNGDAIFTDRPSYADFADEDAILTPFGFFDPTPEPGEPLVDRNALTGPSTVRVNLSISKSFSFGGKRDDNFDSNLLAQGGGSDRGRGRGGRGRGGHGGAGGGDGRYNLSLNVRISNLLNQVNFIAPSGVLTSPAFGIPNRAQSPRRIEAQLRFSF